MLTDTSDRLTDPSGIERPVGRTAEPPLTQAPAPAGIKAHLRLSSRHIGEALKAVWYRWAQTLLWLFCPVLFQIRVYGRQHVPARGAVLLVSNHQSYLDPALVGAGLPRRLHYLAREELYRFPPFRWLILSLDAIPIRASKLGIGGVREALRSLRGGRALLIFPEGQRSHTGQMGPLRPGFCALVRRTRVPMVPVGIQGAYEAWPRHQRFFRPHPIRVCFGAAIRPEQVEYLNDEALVQLVARAIAGACAAAGARGGGGASVAKAPRAVSS